MQVGRGRPLRNILFNMIEVGDNVAAFRQYTDGRAEVWSPVAPSSRPSLHLYLLGQVDWNATNGQYTLLQYAAELGREGVVSLLLEKVRGQEEEQESMCAGRCTRRLRHQLQTSLGDRRLPWLPQGTQVTTALVDSRLGQTITQLFNVKILCNHICDTKYVAKQNYKQEYILAEKCWMVFFFSQIVFLSCR